MIDFILQTGKVEHNLNALADFDGDEMPVENVVTEVAQKSLAEAHKINRHESKMRCRRRMAPYAVMAAGGVVSVALAGVGLALLKGIEYVAENALGISPASTQAHVTPIVLAPALLAFGATGIGSALTAGIALLADDKKGRISAYRVKEKVNKAYESLRATYDNMAEEIKPGSDRAKKLATNLPKIQSALRRAGFDRKQSEWLVATLQKSGSIQA